MADLNSLKNEMTQYYNLKNTLNQVCTYLLKCKGSLEYPATIGSYFKIDEISGDNNSIMNNKNEVNSNYTFLVNQVLPEIDTKIQAINNAIIQEEIRLENKRRAREEAARIAAEQAAQEAARRAAEQAAQQAAQQTAAKAQQTKSTTTSSSSKKSSGGSSSKPKLNVPNKKNNFYVDLK